MKILIKIMDEFYKKIGLIVHFWNDDIMFVTNWKWKMWIQNRCHSTIKIKIKK